LLLLLLLAPVLVLVEEMEEVVLLLVLVLLLLLLCRWCCCTLWANRCWRYSSAVGLHCANSSRSKASQKSSTLTSSIYGWSAAC
jgi:hypothetical protein